MQDKKEEKKVDVRPVQIDPNKKEKEMVWNSAREGTYSRLDNKKPSKKRLRKIKQKERQQLPPMNPALVKKIDAQLKRKNRKKRNQKEISILASSLE